MNGSHKEIVGSPMTHLVRSMGESAPDPSQEEFDAAWQALRSFLVTEMKRRGLWRSPPTFLGIVGHPYWVDHGVVADALDELTAQCFEFVFVRRHASLRQQARQKPDIDGLVRLGIRHFLLEAQRRNDPLGFRIFEVLRRVVEHGERSGGLFVHRAGRRISNGTWIAARPDLVPGGSSSFDPEPLATAWIASHLDGLITSSHAALSALVDALASELAGTLTAAGTKGVLRFGVLATVVKNLGRQAWAERSLETGSIYPAEGDSGTTVPSEDFEQLRRFRRIVACVDHALGKIDERPKTVRYLRRLWRFLRNLSLESEEHPALDRLEAGELPSHRHLAKLLDIPRERVPGLLDTLGGLLRSCRHSMDSLPGSQAMSDPPPKVTPRDRAQASLAQLSHERSASAVSPAVGDILHLAGVDVDGVFWLVVEVDDHGERCLLVPVDQAPLIGPDDAPLRHGDEECTWIARSRHQAWVRLDVLRDVSAGATRIDQVDVGAVDAVRRGAPDAGDFRMDAELPAYREWIEEGPAEARARLTRLPVPFAARGREESARSRRSFPWHVIAAVLALMMVGLVYRLQSVHREVERLAQPIVDLPYREIRLAPEVRGEWLLALPPSAGHVQLGLLLPRLPTAESVRIELHRQGEQKPLFRSKDLVPAREYTLTLPRALVAEEPLTLRILAVSPGATDGAGAAILYELPVRWTTESS